MEIERIQQNVTSSNRAAPIGPEVVERSISEAISPFPYPARIMRYAVLPVLFTIIGLVTASYIVYHRARAGLSPSEQAVKLGSTAFTGVIKPATEIKIAAPASSIVKTLFVKIGDRVEYGQPLLALDDREAQAALARITLEQQAAEQQVAQLSFSIAMLKESRSIATARTELAQASGRVSVAQRRVEQVPMRQWRDSPQRAQATYEQALAYYRRVKTLHEDGVISVQALEDAQTALRTAENDLQNAQTSLKAVETLQKEQEKQADLQAEVTDKEQQQQLIDLNGQLQQARLRYAQATAMVESARQRLAETSIKATSSGAVVELPAKAGDQVVAGATLARIAKFDHLLVEVPVIADLINALHRDQRALVRLPIINSKQIEGTITTISPLPAANMTYTVEVQFENLTGALLVGQPAEVHFSRK